MGGKRTKLPPPTPGASPAPASADALDRVEAHLARTLELVEAAIARGEANPAIVRESAGVARAIVSVAAERRARARQERRRAEDLSLVDVVAFARTLDPAELGRLLRALHELSEPNARARVLG